MERQQNDPIPGTIISADLTVKATDQVRDFYKEVIGWEHSGLSMGNYEDYVMATDDGTPVAGICHPEGQNAGLPAVWLVYFGVKDLKTSIEACKTMGGKIHFESKELGRAGSYAVIEYPEGAFCAITQI
ncbi:VOC family protein [Planococcus sp. 1R117A]|uniref:VOC family protein n=1 Tax=Planococcus sp. 1R117A TaxID=3447020 RepID=UPI003EDC38B6